MVGAVARDVNARDVGLHLRAGSGLEIPALVHFQWRSEWAGVGDMADGNKDAFDGEHRLDAGLNIFDLQAADRALRHAEDLDRNGVPDHLDFLVGGRAISHDLRGAETVAAVDEVNFAGKPGEEKGFFGGTVTAAEDRDFHLAIKGPVARRAGGYASAAVEFFFTRNSREARGCPGRDDDRFGENHAVAAEKFARHRGEIDPVDERLFETGAKARGLLAHVLGELETIDAVGKTGEVFDFAGRRELTAGEWSLEYERAEAGTASVDGRSKAGASGADDDDVFDDRRTHGWVNWQRATNPRARQGIFPTAR